MSIEQNIENLEIRNANVVTFVGSSSTIVDTISGRIQCKGFQHNSNVITDISGPHGRGAAVLKKYPEIVFEDGKFDSNESTNTYVQAGYTVTDSSHHNEYYGAWIFDDQTSFVTNKNLWISPINTYTTSGGAGTPTMTVSDAQCTSVNGVATPGEWVQLKLPNKVKLSSISIMGPTDGNQSSSDLGRSPKDAVLAGSVDGTTWNSVLTWSGVTDWVVKVYKSFPANVDSTNYYNYFRLIVKKNDGTQVYASIQELQLYGYEEDPPAGDHSVDTTIKSRFNNPQLTGVQVFVDGKGSGSNQISGGPTVTDVATTYNEPGKYWELTGELTSNISVEANTFLEGDQPHAVSVWFNSSNLEANVSNTCVFSIASEEKLDSVNLDLQSNTWHNLTYTYQGEGGSKVTYLDGHKVEEAQVEDTFGEYPPFAMTGYTQGGYAVSASNPDGGTEFAWKYYDNDNSTIKTFGNYYGNSGSYNRSPPTNHGGNVLSGDAIPNGEWHKIQMPHKLKLGSIGIRPRNSGNLGEPVNWSLYGSNDDVNWTMLYKKTDSTVPDDALETQYPVNTTSGFSYFLIVMTKSAGYVYLNVAEFNWYGHRENDLVRLPDPTNVLKYPHIAMTGYAQRGYVASASSEYLLGGSTTYQAWEAFNNIAGSQSQSWLSTGLANTYGGAGSTYGTVRSANLGSDSGGTATPENGEWLKIQMPHALIVSHIRMKGTVDTTAHPKTFKLYGSNNGTSWNEILSVVGASTLDATGTQFTPTSTPDAYNYFGLVVTANHGRNSYVEVSELQFYGTGVDSIPIQIGGGNIDKVANFRVYDKFIEEDQVLEIWNAQKEEFGRAKPQMVLQQGKLGIGTDAPQGSLSVADEPDPTTYGLQEFPPKPLVGYKTHIEGHGVFCASASSWYNQSASHDPVYPWNAFNKGALGFSVGNGHGNNWEPAGGGNYNTDTGLFEGSGSNLETSGIGGDWVQLELPYAITLDHMKFMPAYYNDGSHTYLGAARSPKDGHIMASNDGIIWTSIYNWVSRTDFTQLEYTTFKVPGTVTKAYKYFRVVWTRTNSTAPSAGSYDTYASAGEIEFFGYREQVTKQSVLHDGQLTLTKNLTVPSIGPSVTDTRHTVPKRHKLVLEFDTSTNPTDLTTVRDTSGMGNDGTLAGTAYYSISDKAFTGFPSSSANNISGNLSGVSGAYAHTQSYWINGADTTPRSPFGIGKDISTTREFLNMWFTTSKWVMNIDGFGFEYVETISANQWYHLAVTYDGGSVQDSYKFYLNGEYKTPTSVNSASSFNSLNFPSNPEYRIGRNNTTQWYNGMVSDPKIYSGALTAGDVKTLYDMGRGDSYHVTNFKNTLVGINLGNGQAPRSALDVRDKIYAESSTVQTFTGQHICFPDESIEKGLIVSAKKNRFVKLNGFATGREAITIDESLPIVSLSNVVQDKACFGVVSKMEESNTEYRTEITGGLVSESVKIAGDNRAIVNSVGEGAIWIVDTGGSLESGDYITTSNVAGYGQKQDGAGLMNYTVAKITMDCDFTASNVTVQTIKREETGLRTITEDAWNQLVDYDRSSNTETQYSNTLVSSAYTDQPGYVPREVTTIVDYTDGSNLISVAEWSDLESNIQNTYQSNTFTEIVDYTKFVNLSEWSNLTAETQATYSEAEITTYYQIQRGGNVLDENGQLQFEDKTGATEAPYEKRFLTVDGTQTDEANAVHIAAFVGCTYHCG